MLRFSIKKLILIIIFIISTLFYIYRRSFLPKDIDLSYEGIMFNELAYITGDYDNLNIKETTVHIRGELYRPWFKTPYIIGYIDTDSAAVDETALRPSYITIDGIPGGLMYDRWLHSPLKNLVYAFVHMDTDLSKIHLSFEDDDKRISYSTSTGHYGNSVVAPAESIEDLDDEWKDWIEYRIRQE